MTIRHSHKRPDTEKRIHLTTMISLLFLLALFLFLPRRWDPVQAPSSQIKLNIVVESVPNTEQRVRRGRVPPVKPAVPLAVEDPLIPDNAVIDPTEMMLEAGLMAKGRSGLTVGQPDTVLPVPLLQVMPAYPKEARERNRSGVVRLLVKVNTEGQVVDVVVSQNTTNSELCARAAVQAAFKSRYQPGSIGDRTLPLWTVCEYGFYPE